MVEHQNWWWCLVLAEMVIGREKKISESWLWQERVNLLPLCEVKPDFRARFSAESFGVHLASYKPMSCLPRSTLLPFSVDEHSGSHWRHRRPNQPQMLLLHHPKRSLVVFLFFWILALTTGSSCIPRQESRCDIGQICGALYVVCRFFQIRSVLLAKLNCCQRASV